MARAVAAIVMASAAGQGGEVELYASGAALLPPRQSLQRVTHLRAMAHRSAAAQ